MVVIFGFGAGRPDDLGEVVPTVCPNCHNQVFLHHVRSKKSVRLYFVPVVPYGTDDYLVCPVCSQGLQLSAAQLPHLRSMSAAVTAYRTGRIPEAQLMAQADLFWRQLGVSPAGAGQRQPAPPGRGAYPAAQQGIPPHPTVPPQPAPAQPAARAQPAAPAQPAAAAQPPPAAADDEKSWIAQLRKLSELHDQGVLSDAAYAAAKQRIIKQE